MNLLNNWLVQVIIGNIAWIIFCKIIKWLHIKLNSSNTNSSNTEKTFSKQFINKQFKVCFFICSILTISLIVMFVNELQKQIPVLFLLFLIVIFLGFLIMLGAFDESIDHWKD